MTHSYISFVRLLFYLYLALYQQRGVVGLLSRLIVVVLQLTAH